MQVHSEHTYHGADVLYFSEHQLMCDSVKAQLRSDDQRQMLLRFYCSDFFVLFLFFLYYCLFHLLIFMAAERQNKSHADPASI